MNTVEILIEVIVVLYALGALASHAAFKEVAGIENIYLASWGMALTAVFWPFVWGVILGATLFRAAFGYMKRKLEK